MGRWVACTKTQCTMECSRTTEVKDFRARSEHWWRMVSVYTFMSISLIYLFNKHILSTCHMHETMLGPCPISSNKTVIPVTSKLSL